MAIVRGLLRAIAKVTIHSQSLERAFREDNPVVNTVRLKAHLEAVSLEWQPILQNLEEGSVDDALVLLRSFEGPVN